MSNTLSPASPSFREHYLPMARNVTGIVALAVLISTFSPVKILDGDWIIALVVLGIFYVLIILQYLQKRWLFRQGVNVLAELAASASNSFSIRYRHGGSTYERIVEVTPEARKRLYSGGKIVLRMHPRRPQCVQYLREFDTPEVMASLTHWQGSISSR